MTDRREQILVRLLALAEAVADRAARNEPNITGKIGTAIVLWDGREATPEQDFPRRSLTPTIVEMLPELHILREQPAADIGTGLNAVRLSLIKTVLTDAAPGGTLYVILTPNGGARYDALDPDIVVGRSAEGAHVVRFAIRYPLIPSEL